MAGGRDGGGSTVAALRGSPNYLWVAPVLLMEILQTAMLAPVLPSLQNDFFGSQALMVVGVSQVRGERGGGKKRSIFLGGGRRRRVRREDVGWSMLPENPILSPPFAFTLFIFLWMPRQGVQALLEFLFAPLMGAVSDRYGRKWPIFFSVLASSLPWVTLVFFSGLLLTA